MSAGTGLGSDHIGGIGDPNYGGKNRGSEFARTRDCFLGDPHLYTGRVDDSVSGSSKVRSRAGDTISWAEDSDSEAAGVCGRYSVMDFTSLFAGPSAP